MHVNVDAVREIWPMSIYTWRRNLMHQGQHNILWPRLKKLMGFKGTDSDTEKWKTNTREHKQCSLLHAHTHRGKCRCRCCCRIKSSTWVRSPVANQVDRKWTEHRGGRQLASQQWGFHTERSNSCSKPVISLKSKNTHRHTHTMCIILYMCVLNVWVDRPSAIMYSLTPYPNFRPFWEKKFSFSFS